MILFIFIQVLSALVCFTEAHIFFRFPASRRSMYSTFYNQIGMVDYNLASPLNTPGYSFPCKGYSPGPPTATIIGRTVRIQLEGSVHHSGGHCQFGVSFDNTKFVVLKTVMDNCVVSGLSYELTLPYGFPSGNTILFWTWINKIGNREYYMECADIHITNNNEPVLQHVTGKELLIANLDGYPTIPEFPVAGMYNGEDLFNVRKIISISRGPTSSTTTTSSPTTTSSTKTTSSTTTTSSPTPQCTKEGDTLCQNNVNAGYRVRAHSNWINMPCPLGTRCQQHLDCVILCVS
jgi:hypothetical protein